MKITVSMASVLDALYASTALQALMAERPGTYSYNILTPDQAPALRRIVAEAHAAIVARLVPGWRLVTTAYDAPELVAEASDSLGLDEVTATALLRVAVVEMVAYIIMSVGCDNRARAALDRSMAVIAGLDASNYSVGVIKQFR